MAQQVRIILFLLLSFVGHLLVLTQGQTATGRISSHRQLGVGYVSRSVEQFYRHPEPPVQKSEHKPEPVRKNEPVRHPLKNIPAVIPEPAVRVVKQSPVETVVKTASIEEASSPVVEDTPPVTQQAPSAPADNSAPTVKQDQPVDAGLNAVQPADHPEVELSVPTEPGSVAFQQALPHYDMNPLPYPEVAKRRGQQGTVRLEVLVRTNGRVGDVRLSSSSGHRVLDRAALRAVRHWTFEPATKFGVAVESRVIIPVDFVLASSE